MLAEFRDASVYQSWSYGVVHQGAGKLSHIVVKRGEHVVGLAQVRVTKLPVVSGGVAYVTRGPAWQRKGITPDIEDLRLILAALVEEYGIRRKLYLKVVPNLFFETSEATARVFKEAGFVMQPSRYRTLLVDLNRSIDELRSGLRQSWRKSLNKAEKAAIQIVEGSELSLCDTALSVHREMHERKRYAEFVDMEEFRQMQELLPEGLRMWIVVCKHEGEVVSALGWSVFGDVGVPLIGATRAKALEINASYLMFWHMLVWMKENGFRYCDLAGINPERNPGSYTFKSGIAKYNGVETTLLGEFDFCGSLPSRVVYKTGMWAKRSVARARLMVERFRKSDRATKSEQ